MANFLPGQKLTANDLNEAFDSVKGPMNPSKDYKWQQTSVGKMQSMWDVFIQSENQTPEVLEVGIGYSGINGESVVEQRADKPDALRRVFVNVGSIRWAFQTPGKRFTNCPNIGDVNGIPLLGIVGLEWQGQDEARYMDGNGDLHFSVWSPMLSDGNTPQEWNDNQKLWQNDVVRGCDSRHWWWSGITLERHTPEWTTTPLSMDAEGLDLCCFPLFLFYKDLKSEHPEWSEATYAVLCVMLKKDMMDLNSASQTFADKFYTALGDAYPVNDYTLTEISLGNKPDLIRCLGQYVYSEQTQNAYFKTNLHYIHLDNDTSPLHFASWRPPNGSDVYNITVPVSYNLQWIDDNGLHMSRSSTVPTQIVNLDGRPVEEGTEVEHEALACAFNPATMTQPILSCVVYKNSDIMATGNPTQAILSGLFNDSSYGLSSETQKRLIWMNTMNSRGVEYYDTCPDFRTGETPDSDISSSCLSSIQEKEIELEVEEGQEAQSKKLWSLWGFDDFENVKGWPEPAEISGWDLVTRHIHEVDGKNVGEIQYISLSALSGGGGAPGDADLPIAGLSSIQTRTLTGGEKVLQLYKFDDGEYVENDIGDNLSAYDMVLRNREGNCVAYGSLSAIGGEVDLSGTDGTHKKGSAFKFQSASDSNIIVSIDNNGVITIGAYYL